MQQFNQHSLSAFGGAKLAAPRGIFINRYLGGGTRLATDYDGVRTDGSAGREARIRQDVHCTDVRSLRATGFAAVDRQNMRTHLTVFHVRGVGVVNLLTVAHVLAWLLSIMANAGVLKHFGDRFFEQPVASGARLMPCECRAAHNVSNPSGAGELG